ncbi:MAG: hypothetical protein LW595_02175 [Rickettsiales bacterium]|jgi:hypothetical protein|nr:hypothetical protein [Rickettsiales bacterium]
MKLYKIPHSARIAILNKIEREATLYDNFQDYLVSNQEIQLNNKKFYCHLYQNKIIENINFANSQLTDYLPERLDDVDNYLITIEDKNETLYKINFINNIFSNHSLKSAFILNNFILLNAFTKPPALIPNNFNQNHEFLSVGLISAFSNIVVGNIKLNDNNDFELKKMPNLFDQDHQSLKILDPLLDQEKKASLFRFSCIGRYEPYYDDYYGTIKIRHIKIFETFENYLDYINFYQKYSFNIKSPINNDLPSISIKPNKQEKILLTQKNESTNIATFY